MAVVSAPIRTNRRGRPYREGVASRYQRVVSERHTSSNQNSPRTKQRETGGKMFVEHLQAFCPWIMMMMMK